MLVFIKNDYLIRKSRHVHFRKIKKYQKAKENKLKISCLPSPISIFWYITFQTILKKCVHVSFLLF